ncbi:MAG: methionyl-tRNA formyltransferase [Kiloniellales bacterium]
MPALRIAFMGTPDFAVPSLLALLDAGHQVPCVYCQPPRRAGRGHRVRPSPVQQVAESRGIELRTPLSLKDPAEGDRFAALDLDAAVVAAYGLILPPAMLEAPRLGCLNVHASLLPRWRGAAPVQHAILAGDRETGVSIMVMDPGLDTGPILLRERLPIAADATAETLEEALARLGAGALMAALDGLAAGRLHPTPQDQAGASYAPKLSREDGRLDWTRPAPNLERQVRAFAPWPGAWFTHGGERIKVLAAECTDGAGAPGAVLDDRLTVACGDGALRLARVQRAGRAPMDAATLLRGYPLPPGIVLETVTGDDSLQAHPGV